MDLYEKINSGYYRTKLPYGLDVKLADVLKVVEDTFVGTLAQINAEKARVT